MYTYAIINKDGFILGISQVNNKINDDNMILIEKDFNTINKKYENGKWVEYIKEEEEPTISQQEIINAQILSQLEYLGCLQELNIMKGGDIL